MTTNTFTQIGSVRVLVIPGVGEADDRLIIIAPKADEALKDQHPSLVNVGDDERAVVMSASDLLLALGRQQMNLDAEDETP